MSTQLTELVMGLHWDPTEEGLDTDPADLDAICVLFDAQGRVSDVVHPRHLRTEDGAVVHTGDSRTGASEWDDERIFVFLNALPEAVAALSFAVASPAGRSFGKVRGASCHVSDNITDRELIRVQFSRSDGHTFHCVATVHRCPAGWRISMDGGHLSEHHLETVLAQISHGKSDARGPLSAGAA